MRRTIFLTSAICLLAGCATTAPVVQTIPVKVPVPIACNPMVSPEPEYPDTDQAIALTDDLIPLAKLYRAGRALRMAYEAELLAALKGCSGP